MNTEAPGAALEPMHWALMGEYYSLYASPLKPCGQDVAAFQRAVSHWRTTYGRQHLRILQCGVTPAIASMAWPDDAELVAVDKTEAVIRALWPHPPGRRWVLCADWLQLPQADASCDVAAGDGSFNCVKYPQEYLALASSLHRILKTGGLLLMRCFTRPDRQETPEQVFMDLRAGRCASFHEFKWRLAMALQPDTAAGVRVGDVFNAWAQAGMSTVQLCRQTGWNPKVLDTIRIYEGKETLLSFPTLAELQAVLLAAFDPISIETPQYPLGERCPTISFVKRQR